MRCAACGAEAGRAARFCPSCGAALALTCASCGRTAGADDRFCAGCGAALDTARARAPVGDELRPVTVVFADLAGSVARTYGLDAESAAEQVNEVLTAMAGAVATRGGTIDRFLGDGTLAIFGAPTAREDDPERALLAAFDLRERVRRLGAEVTVGINTGEAYVGRMGSSTHEETTAMGTTVNLAARLQGAARPGEILVGEATWAQTRSAFEFEERLVDVKGIDQSVRAFLAVAPVATTRRRRRRSDGPLVARADEIAALERACAAVAAGHGHVVSIIGEPGVGKSRLVAELETRAGAAGLAWLEGACFEATPVAFGPFLDALRGWLVTQGTDDARGVLGGLGLDERAAAQVSALVSMDEKALHDLPPESLHRELLAALRSTFVGMATRQPTVLVLEDLHWADPTTLALAGVLAGAIPDVALLLVHAYRPERDLGCWRLGTMVAQTCGEHATELSLRGLGAAETDRLIDELVGPDAGGRIDAHLRRHIRHRTQGNPFFVEELLRSIVEGRSSDVAVPGTVQAVIRSRIDRLSGRERDVLQLAAVIGPVFPLAVLAGVDGGDDLRSIVESLERKEFVYQQRLLPEEEYAFRHVLVQETAYGGLLRRRRAEVHALVGAAVEALHAGRLEEQYDVLAHHFARSGDDERAAGYLYLAGERAYRLHRHDAAVELLTTAVERAATLPDAATRQLAAHEVTADAHAVSGRHDEARRSLKSALALVPPGAALALSRLHRKVAHAWQTQRDYGQALAAYDEATAALEAAGDRDTAWWREWIQVGVQRMQLNYWKGTVSEITTLAEQLDGPITAHGTPRQRADYLSGLVMQRIRDRRYVIDDDVRRWADEVLVLLREDPDLAHRAFHQFNQGFVNLWARELGVAELQMTEALTMADRVGDVVVQSRCLTYLTVAARFSGDVALTEDRAVRARSVATAGEMVEYEAAADASLAWVALRRGDLDAVVDRAEAAVEAWGPLALVYGFRWLALYPLMAARLASGDGDGALEAARGIAAPDQQRLPDEVWLPLEAALAGGDPSRLHDVLGPAALLGYV